MNDLFGAIARNDSASLARLLDSGADPDLRDSDNRTALMYASIAGRDELIGILVRHDANVNAQDKNGFTALHFAAQDQQFAAAEALCRSGASVDLPDKYGNTALWRAVFSSHGRGELITLLLQYGADASKPNKAGKTPIDLANTIANYDVKKFFPATSD